MCLIYPGLVVIVHRRCKLSGIGENASLSKLLKFYGKDRVAVSVSDAGGTPFPCSLQ
jgi:hypothetical protein